jgi:Uma2 family endonuclease
MAPTVMTQETTSALLLSVASVGLTDEQFLRLCSDNSDLRIELTAQKVLVIMSPAGSKTGWRNARLTQRLANWTEQDDTGLAFDSSAGFILPNGAKRAPDAAWVRRERWEALSEEEQEVFAPLCPDFVVELRSPSDTLAMTQEKMREYIDNGAQLGWLIDPRTHRVYVYRPGEAPVCLEQPTILSAQPVLPGFIFNVQEIW